MYHAIRAACPAPRPNSHRIHPVLRPALWVLILTLQLNGSVSESSPSATVTVHPEGSYIIAVNEPTWTFAGDTGRPLSNLAAGTGRDGIGEYREVRFTYSEGGPREAAIRLYLEKPIILFTVRYLATAENASPFPILTTYPRGLDHLTYNGIFGIYSFNRLAEDSPWVFFDSDANTFVLSPASSFMTASTRLGEREEIRAGIIPEITTLPAGFTHRTLLVAGRGINRALETWGRALTDLQGKTRPGPDADRVLTHLGYWTDYGASYYYDYERDLGYENTLLAIRDAFERMRIPLGYLQLDSWFYPKGPLAEWVNAAGGIHHYAADTTLFPGTLKLFQERLGLPLVTHGRWLDPQSPYRGKYKISGNVAIDSSYWDDVAEYLKEAGAITYEQDWLGAHARTAVNLSDPDAFLDNMARACRKRGLTIQYCMPLPRHYLQSSKYDNVTTIRTSNDRFERTKWNEFLYGSRLASALGVWPWADVFMSTELDNLILANLSAGPVGVGDRVQSLHRANLLRAARPDGLIVKPDVPIVPLDETVLRDAQGLQAPMVAAAYTRFGSIHASYVFAYSRAEGSTVEIKPASLGFETSVYIYNFLRKQGKVIEPEGSYTEPLEHGWGYYIAAPVGPSGIAFLGDTRHFVSLGKARIAEVSDDGTLTVKVAFADQEKARTIHGYSASRPDIAVLAGAAGRVTYDPATKLFRVRVFPGPDQVAVVALRP